MTVETHCKALELKSSLDEEVIRDQKAEIERLQAIVAKLPVTADGVPVVPHAGFVYYPGICILRGIVRRSDSGNKWCAVVQTRTREIREYDVSECCSTREAAENAKGNK